MCFRLGVNFRGLLGANQYGREGDRAPGAWVPNTSSGQLSAKIVR